MHGWIKVVKWAHNLKQHLYENNLANTFVQELNIQSSLAHALQ